jgi:glycosyltransferase involved in cell wall biosynthesis
VKEKTFSFITFETVYFLYFLISLQKKILYISYDGMTDPLGQSQVIPYLSGLLKKGYSFHLISCEKKTRFLQQGDSINKLLQENNIEWHPLPYTKSPPVLSTMLDMMRMEKKAIQLHKQENFSIVHCRSYIASLTGLQLKRKYNLKFIFDMRGFWADERVEAGMWNMKNPVYKMVFDFFKRKEKEFFNEADYTISLTHAGKKEIHSWKNLKQPVPVEVIPCCADFSLFTPEKINHSLRQELKNKFSITENDFVLSYLGSVSTWYRLNEMFRFFRFIQKKKGNSKFLFITADSPEVIFDSAKRNGIDHSDIIITSSARKEVPTFLSLSHLSVFFYKDGFSRCAVSPTKQAEVMGLGIPHICNAGVGDVETIVKDSGAGYAVTKFADEEFEKAFEFVTKMKITKDEIRNEGIKYYSLEKGVEKYASIYEKLLH